MVFYKYEPLLFTLLGTQPEYLICCFDKYKRLFVGIKLKNTGCLGFPTQVDLQLRALAAHVNLIARNSVIIAPKKTQRNCVCVLIFRSYSI